MILLGRVVRHENFRAPRVILRDPENHVTYVREGDARWSQRFRPPDPSSQTRAGKGDVNAHDMHSPLVELEMDVAIVRGRRRDGTFAL